jgi:hypothetical protein
VSNPKVQGVLKPDRSKQPESFKKDSPSTFSEDQIRTRAYQIYESRGSIHKRSDEDWSQAEIELMELVDGK